jgi:hypothetical protein
MDAMTPEWAAILRTHDQAILLMFVGVCAFALNWYAFGNNPAVQRVMAWIPLLSSVVIIALEIAKS